MAYGKNKKLSKGKKGQKKKQIDPFVRKNWYDIKAPAYLNAAARRAGRTPVTKTTGQRIETDGLVGRVAEFNLADLALKNEDTYKKIKLVVEDITGRTCLTDFHGLSLTRDKMNHLIRKRHSLIDVKTDVRTNDGYVVRLFLVLFTREAKDQAKIFSYAQASQIKKIRKKVTTLVQSIVGSGSLKNLVQHLVSDKIETDVKAAVTSIFPCDPIHIHKVKLVKKPKLDVTKLLEIHEGGVTEANDGGVQLEEAEESKNLLAAK